MVIALAILLAAWVLGRSAAPAHPAAHHGKSAKGAIMADTYTVSGAVNSLQFNQDYNESSGPDNYSSSDTFETLFYNTNAANGPVNSWILTDVVGNPPAYYAAGTLLAGPAGLDYNVGSAGTSPAPTVSGGDPRLQIGGPAVTFSLPTTGATGGPDPDANEITDMVTSTVVSDTPYTVGGSGAGENGWNTILNTDSSNVTVKPPSSANATYAIAGHEYKIYVQGQDNYGIGYFVLLPPSSARRRSPAIHF